MRDIIERAEHAGHTIHLRVNHHDDDSFDPDTNTVHWDPLSALRTTDGGKQSPALGLGHELDHATVRASVRERGRQRFDLNYDNVEERRVICGSERHAARVLGSAKARDTIMPARRIAFPLRPSAEMHGETPPEQPSFVRTASRRAREAARLDVLHLDDDGASVTSRRYAKHTSEFSRSSRLQNPQKFAACPMLSKTMRS